MTPAEVDGTTLWKIAAFLGVDIDRQQEYRDLQARLAVQHQAGDHTTEKQAHCPLCGEPSETPGWQVPSERDLIAERFAYERGEGPRPEADPLTPGAAMLAREGLIRAPTESGPRAPA